MKMEEKMNGLNELINGVDTYCNDNKIEYLFAAVAEEGKHVLIKHNTVANVILKEAAKIVKTLVKDK
jgi:N-acetylglucosamine kinase-like BadF-type ATPase